ncbi:MAG: oxidoreductase [Hyphococcus sp.]|nr:MAG: oxidoreductase [Marinicaulis sp.]
MTHPQQTAVVTGVSTGIGRAIAKTLIDNGWRVFGSVRKENDAKAAQDALGDQFSPLLFDVTDPDAIASAAQSVRADLNGQALNGLVNNAGIAVGGPLRYLPPEELKQQFDVNIFGVLHVTQAFLPLLGADHTMKGPRGKIVNMSSVAGKMASPIMGPYSMSKHALEAFTVSLRRELLMHGIDVVAVGPGAIQTPIWDKADDIDAENYKGTEYYDILVGMRKKMQEFGAEGLPPEAVGNLAYDILNGTKQKTRYAILKDKFANWTLPQFLPSRLVDKFVADRFGFPSKVE